MTGQGVQRVFLGWDRPGLEPAARWLVQHAPTASVARDLDLSKLIVVIPGGRAGRQLLNHLVTLAEERQGSLIPPEIVTVGHLLDHLCPSTRPAPGELLRSLTWVRVLESCPEETLAAVLPNPPDRGDTIAWLRLGALIDQVHVELGGHGLLFADVARSAPAGGDGPRWEAMAQVQVRFLSELKSTGTADPHAAAMDQVRDGRVHITSRVVLVAVSELPALSARALRSIAPSVSALIVAPPDRADGFDDLGCVLPEQWGSAAVDLPIDRIRIVDSPDDQADAAIEALAELGDRFATDQVVIGVPDTEVVPRLQARAGRHGAVRVRDASGLPVERSGPVKLIEAIRAFAASGSFQDWATLLRHPAVEAHLAPRLDPHQRPIESWLGVLDDYAAGHIPGTVSGRWMTDDQGDLATLSALYDATRELLGPFWPAEGSPPGRGVGQWAEPLLAVVRTIYGGRTLNTADPSHRATIESCSALQGAAEEMAGLATRIPDARPFTGVEALGVLLMLIEGKAIAPEPDPAAVGLLGWLELAFDDAGAVVVTGMNEGRVPRSHRADAILPDGLRAGLGLPCAASHAARDLYLLSVLAASRPDLILIAGRRARRGDPLLPSRLLFACPAGDLLERVRRYVPRQTIPGPRRTAARAPGATSQFIIKPTAPFEPVTAMSVTAFSAFIRSPYGFFLERVLRLREQTDQVSDLDSLSFGIMVHEALRDFGRGPAAGSTVKSDIRDAMHAALDAYIARMFGTHAPVAVQLQHAQARERLDEVAAVQADRRQQGWRIVHTEWSPPGGVPFDVDGQPMILRGKIDRIDRHDQDGRYLILDYKTSEKGEEPGRTHQTRSGEWLDLQLPLYRHLAESITAGAPVQLAYFVIPGDPDTVEVLPAEWAEDDLRGADEAAREVIRSIRRGEVFDLGDHPPDSGILGAICGLDLVADSTADAEGEDES